MKALTRFMEGVASAILTFLFVLLLLIVGSIVMSPARAEAIQCSGVADMLARLDSQRHERQLFIGQMGGGGTAMLTVNPAGASWTLLVVGPEGKACIAALGPKWRAGDTPGPPALGTEG